MDFARENQHQLQCVMEKECGHMPSFSPSLERALHQALTIANERHHEYATLEHLLLALIDDQDAGAVMRACNVDLEHLKRIVTDYIDRELDNLVTGYD